MNGLNLTEGWNKLWSTLTGGNNIGVLLAAVGILLIIIFLAKWFWAKRRGNGGDKFPTMMIVLGAILAGPSLLIPVIITGIEAVLGLGINLFKAVANML